MFANEYNQDQNRSNDPLDGYSLKRGIVCNGIILSDESSYKVKELINNYVEIPNNLIESMYSFLKFIDELDYIPENKLLYINSLIEDVSSVLAEYNNFKLGELENFRTLNTNGEIDSNIQEELKDNIENLYLYWEELSEKTAQISKKVNSIVNYIKEENDFSFEYNENVSFSTMFNAFADNYLKIFFCDFRDITTYDLSSLLVLSRIVDSHEISLEKYYTNIPFVIIYSSINEIFCVMSDEIRGVFNNFTKNFTLGDFLTTVNDRDYNYSSLDYLIRSKEGIFNKPEIRLKENGYIELKYNCPPSLSKNLLERVDAIKKKLSSTSKLLQELGLKLDVNVDEDSKDTKIVISIMVPKENFNDSKAPIFLVEDNSKKIEEYSRPIPFKFKDIELIISSNLFDGDYRRHKLVKDINYLYQNFRYINLLKSCEFNSSNYYDEVKLLLKDINNQNDDSFLSEISFPRRFINDKNFLKKLEIIIEKYSVCKLDLVCIPKSECSVYDQIYNQLNYVIDTCNLILSDLCDDYKRQKKINIQFENVNNDMSSFIITDSEGRCLLFDDYYLF